jgi:hypothetical protein
MNVQNMSGTVTSVDVNADVCLRVTGDDGREYIIGAFGDYIDLDQSLRPPPFHSQNIDSNGNPWINKRVEFEYTEFRGQLLILKFINLRLK